MTNNPAQPGLDRISFSAVREYLGNPWRFYLIYVRKERVFTDSPATLVGKAFHKALELYYGSVDYRSEEGKKIAIEAGLTIIRQAAAQVDWGVTGSLEKAEKDALQTIEHYFAADPYYEKRPSPDPLEVVVGEELQTETIMSARVSGIKLPIKVVADLIRKNEKQIIDFKKVSSLTKCDNFETLPGVYKLQALFNKWGYEGTFGHAPSSMVFHEVKTSVNRDKSPQVNRIRIDFTSSEWKDCEKKLKKLVQQVVRDVTRKNRVWLPNIADQMAGEDSFNEWIKTV